MGVFDDNKEPADRPISPPPSIWTPRRRELLAWFRDQAYPLSEAYEGAVKLMGDAAFPGRVHFVAHAVRDMADRLVDVLDPQTKGSRVQYENEMDVIVKDWPTMEPMDGSEAGPGVEESLAIPIQVARRIDRLVRAHRDRRKRPTQYELLFRFLMRNEPSQPRRNERLVGDFKSTRDWFMARTHLRSGEPPQVDEGEFQSQFKKFEAMLHSFVGRFSTGTSELDAILQKANERRR